MIDDFMRQAIRPQDRDDSTITWILSLPSEQRDELGELSVRAIRNITFALINNIYHDNPLSEDVRTLLEKILDLNKHGTKMSQLMFSIGEEMPT